MEDQVLRGIAEQLSTQITFSNELMARLQGLEAQHTTYPRQASEKQAQLRAALTSAEGARAEAADLRQRLAASQVRWRIGRGGGGWGDGGGSDGAHPTPRHVLHPH